MKRFSLLLLVSLFGIQYANASTEKDTISRFTFQKLLLDDDDCDACGCSANGGSIGFSSVFNNDFVGIRYFYQKYRSKDGIFNNSPSIPENFNTVQIWSRIPITERIQVGVLIPYHIHNRELSAGNETIQGIGDVTLLANYVLYQTHKDSTIFTHKWLIGAGFKAPTGKFDTENNKGTVNSSFQLGTGSWDYLITTEYILKRKQLGWSSQLNYTFKTPNEKTYQFGNQFNYGTTFFYLLDWNKVKVVPQVGVAGEVYQENKQYNLVIPETAGDVFFGKFGIEIGKNDFSLGINALLPVNQNLSNKKVEAQYRWAVNLNYSL